MAFRTKVTELPTREVWPPYMRREDLAAYLRCAVSGIDKLRFAGKLPPPKKVGRLVLWSKVAVDAWLLQSEDGPRAKP
jgi:predicted DNA-binding transcriptional regulator AlpA